MARIVTFAEYGAPDVLKIEEVALPKPGPDDIRIAVKAIGLNRAESMWRTGVYVEPVNLPGRLGYESAGVIEAVGENVTHLAVGDEVSTMPAFSMNDYGLYGDHVLAPASAAVKKPSSISFEEAVSIWNPFITAWGAFIESGIVTDKDTVIITASSSSVGIGAIQIAKLAGAKVIATTRTREKVSQIRMAGADHVIVTDEEDLVVEVERITHGAGATVAFDPVGGPAFPKLIDALAPGGTVMIYGALSDEVTPLPMLRALAKEVVIRGYNLFSITTTPARQAQVAQFVYENLEAGKLKITISKYFRFEQIVEAHRELEKNQHIGRIVVTL
ncbi:zinc-dependent alcohol dehydrogenase family protein [Paraburkholderia sp. MMS20-SJTR3]|uniref:Zinc-dependent alcohol dehydrogenase family protein n=1 Tax=Paraburkholderia sejongensis TaxID=2886946 RepID=A0ABS8JZS5_9BURK|nr:zinc-dependent alcohol dehydrogenase family protein [Paraburkholderia sp. MMS20-SJTR3]MCC8395395.1 zinc-dependent alcohol dehydrogenase family protein [Paraburkholderia sp. MMS20-SJTR3]